MRPKNLVKEQAIRTMALQIIAEEGLENLTMQKLAKAAGISPRTIYIKYRDKEDLLVKLFIEEVFGPYEKAALANFSEDMAFVKGIRTIWLDAFRHLIHNKHHFVLMQYGKSSPLLNNAFMEAGIKEGHFFAPLHRFITRNVKEGIIRRRPFEANRALLFSPLFDLVNEYLEHLDRPRQIISEKLVMECCETVLKGILK
jgi:AcrR family transcriptional regulator